MQRTIVATRGRTLCKDDYLVITPNSLVPDIEAGADGAQLLELSRTVQYVRPVEPAKI